MLQLSPTYLPTPQSQWTTVTQYKNIFSDQIINDLTQMVTSNYKFEKGETGSQILGTATSSYSTNHRQIAYIHPEEWNKWLYDLLFPLVEESNSKYYHFDIDIVTDPIHYVIYPSPTSLQSNDGGHLEWHMDIGDYEVNRRKLALTVELSNPEDYEGGDFEILFGGAKEPVRFPRNKGDVFIFPTFLMHRVTPITKGERRALVFWVGGRPFR